MFYFSILKFLIQLNFIKSFDDCIEFVVFVVFVVDVKSGNEVNDLVLVFDGVDPPVVDNEFQLRNFTVALGNFGIFVEGLTHDGNKHIQKMNTHKQSKCCEENGQDWRHLVISKLRRI